MTTDPYLTYGSLRLLNLPAAKPLYDEVLKEDCYRMADIPNGSAVIDVGAFYGEFGIWCAVEKGCSVLMFEPSPYWGVANLNIELNCPYSPKHVRIFNEAICGTEGIRDYFYRPEHPAGSRVVDVGINCTSTVPSSKLQDAIQLSLQNLHPNTPVCIKMDCEGSEREIFEDESWIPLVHVVKLEWHNKDGHKYRDILVRHGFEVELTDNNPEAWSGILHAVRKQI